jgi:hypothetical protein
MHVLFGNFRWMPILGVMLGLVGAFAFWEEQQQIRIAEARGAEATATIIQIRRQSDSQNKNTSYWADIRWRDAAGKERIKDRIPVSGTFARRVMKDGRVVQHETRIKYLADDPEARPLLLEDRAHNDWITPGMMWLCLGFAAFAAYGWVHMLLWERRAARRAGASGAA